jgi:cellulose synthase operon protein C
MERSPRLSIPPMKAALRPTLISLCCGALLALTAATAAANPKASQFYEDALQRFEKKDHKGAIIQLRNALKADNRQLAVHVLLGKALLANGEAAAAEVAFTDALKLGVNRAEVVVPLARSIAAQGRRQPLLDDPRFARAGLPDTVRAELLIEVAAAHSDLGRPREALAALDEARSLDPKSAQPWMSEVPIRIRARQMNDAAAAAARGVALAPKSADAVYLVGSVMHVRGQLAAASASYTQALALDPAHVESLLARAGIATDDRRDVEARRDVDEVIRLRPNEARALYLRAVLAERAGDTKLTRDSLNEVTALLDRLPLESMRYKPQVLILGGLAHHGLGQREKAKPYLEAVQRDQPGSPVSKLLGQIHLADGNADRAIESLEGYLRSFPNDSQALSMLASAHMSQGRHPRAAQIMRDALQTQDKPGMRSILGASLVRAGRNREALKEFETAYARDPGQIQAGAALVGLYLADGQAKKAVVVAEALVKRQPGQAPLVNLLGLAQRAAGAGAKAREAFEQASRLDAAFMEPRLNLARLDIAEGRVDAAVERLNAILRADDKHIDTLIEAGQLAASRGRTDDATRLLTRASDLSTAPTDRNADFTLLEHHLRGGRIPLAQESARRLLAKAPDNPQVLMASARVSLAAKAPDAAKQALTNAARNAGFDAEILSRIALLQLAAADAKAAVYTLNKALQADPQHLPSQALLVDASIRTGDIADADKRARDVATRNPRLALGQALVGDVAAARGQWPASIEAYRKAHTLEPTPSSAARLQRALSQRDVPGALRMGEQWLKANPRDLPVLLLHADNLALSRNMAAARGAYEQALQLSPNNANALNNYAHVLLALGDGPGATKAAAAALAARPDAPFIIGTAGWVAFKTGQPDRALQLLRDARLRDPENPDTRYYLAAALAAAGRKAEARDELRAALQAGREFASAADAQELLRSLN